MVNFPLDVFAKVRCTRVSSPFISKWKINYALHGIEGLRLNHQGSRGQLKPEERAEVIEWLTIKSSGIYPNYQII